MLLVWDAGECAKLHHMEEGAGKGDIWAKTAATIAFNISGADVEGIEFCSV